MRPLFFRAFVFGLAALAFGACADPAVTLTTPTYTTLGEALDKETSADAWIGAKSMTTARARHTAARLNDGEILVAGGTDDASTAFASAEIWDPTKDTWRSTSTPMVKARHSHANVTLMNGLVLITGGSDDPDGQHSLPDAELYDPDADAWLLAPPMAVARRGHTLTALDDKTVLAVGGSLDGEPSSEIYSLEIGAWTPAVTMKDYHLFHTATLLNDGRVLVVGGPLPDTLAEISNPLGTSWTQAAPIKTARRSHTATLLDDGRVLVTGGFPFDVSSFGVTSDAEIYDPKADTWTRVSPMQKARSKHTATLLLDHTVLVTGGIDGSFAALAEAEIYDPVHDTWTTVAPMPQTHAAHTATILKNGVVLIAGGFLQATAELYSPRLRPIGSACGAPGDCMSDFCVDGVCCDTPCQVGACDACSMMAGATEDGKCTLVKDTAECDFQTCTRPSDCASGHCADGVCCDSECVGDCSSCATKASPGQCTQAPPGTDPRRACGDNSACAATCEANGACGAAKPEETVCANRACAEDGSSVLEEVTCQAQTGACAVDSRAETSCGLYRCDPEISQCLTSCRSIRDCATGYACDKAGVCVRPPDVSSSDGGCSLVGRSARRDAPLAAALLLLLTLRRRRASVRHEGLRTRRELG